MCIIVLKYLLFAFSTKKLIQNYGRQKEHNIREIGKMTMKGAQHDKPTPKILGYTDHVMAKLSPPWLADHTLEDLKRQVHHTWQNCHDVAMKIWWWSPKKWCTYKNFTNDLYKYVMKKERMKRDKNQLYIIGPYHMTHLLVKIYVRNGLNEQLVRNIFLQMWVGSALLLPFWWVSWGLSSFL